ncbi:MAG: cyclic nucleotide-binding domain-containing protein [Acidobacteriota bacterium]
MMVAKQSLGNEEDLGNSPLFVGVDLETIREVLERCSVNDLQRGEFLIRARERNEYLYVLLTGRLRIHLNPNMSPVAVLDPGAVVGELSIIDQQLTSAYVIADDVCRVLVISEPTIWALVEASHAVAQNLMRILTRRLRDGNSLLLASHFLLGRYSAALPLFEALDAVSPEDPVAKYYMGLIYFINDDPTKGRVFLREAIKLNPALQTEAIDEFLND